MAAILSLMMLAPSAASARQALCGSGTVSSPAADVFVTTHQRPGQPPFADYVTATTFSSDRRFSMLVSYDLKGDALGPPKYVSLDAYMPLPDPAQAQPERIAWRIGDGDWSGKPFTFKPQRRWGDPARTEGYLSAIIPPDGFIALLDAAVRSELVAVRRLDADGKILTEGTVRFPATATIQALYAKARASAIANLKVCGAPLAIPPAKH